MGVGRIIYQEWIVALGRDPGRSWQEAAEVEPSYNRDDVRAVTEALEALAPEEADFIRRFYFQGLAYEDISRETGRDIGRLILLHRRAVKSLVARLRPWSGGRKADDDPVRLACPLCRHPDREEIERLLHTKRSEETWKRILTILRRSFGMPHLTPRQIVGHLKYHHPVGKMNLDPGPGSAATIA